MIKQLNHAQEKDRDCCNLVLIRSIDGRRNLNLRYGKAGGMIHSLGLLITIGKYLPLMIAGFATLNLTLAYFDLFVWNHIGFGILNTILALAGFIFLGQLLNRRKIHRYDYRYTGRHLRKMQPPRLHKNEGITPIHKIQY